MPKQTAIALLKADHAAVKKLFAQEQRAAKQDDEKKQSIFDQIKDALTVHATIEEEIFYPAVKKARQEHVKEKARQEHVKDEVREGYEEHRQIKNLLAQIASITPDDETWDMKIKVLKEDVEHHVKEEEGEMFPDARKFLGERRLIELGAELQARKQELKENPPTKLSRNQTEAFSAAK
jgi:hemerythrin superfamily protein